MLDEMLRFDGVSLNTFPFPFSFVQFPCELFFLVFLRANESLMRKMTLFRYNFSIYIYYLLALIIWMKPRIISTLRTIWTETFFLFKSSKSVLAKYNFRKWAPTKFTLSILMRVEMQNARYWKTSMPIYCFLITSRISYFCAHTRTHS